jgi:hypothetical protein
MLQVASPNGNEPLRTGLRFFVTWNDNIAENVIIDLYKAGAFLRSLTTNSSTGAYQWQVPLDLAAGNDYSIKISSVANAALFDSSDAPFSIDAPTFDANALTHLPDGRIEFQITAPGATQATVLGSTNMLVWDEIGTMALTNGVGVFLDDNATNHLHRFYRLRVP